MTQVERSLADSDKEISESLRTHVFRGLRWSAVIVLTNQILRILTSFIMVRLLTPDDYGLASMALVFGGLVIALSDLGLGAGLVQRESISETDCATVFWTSVVIGVALVATGVAMSGLIARFFHEPQVRPLFIAMSFGFLFPALQQTPAALLQRAMNFRAITIRSIGASVAASIVGIVGAAIGWGAWALIASALTLGLVTTVILWATCEWKPKLTYSRESLRDLGGFGIALLGARSLDYAQANTDNILVGRYLGAGPLGLYSVGYNVILLPTARIFIPLQDALFPALSRIQGDKARVASIWLRTVRVVGAFVSPLMLGTIVIAPDLVLVLFGQKWTGSVPVLQILALVTLMTGFTAVGERALMARGRTGLLLRISTVRTLLSVAAFAVGLQWGIVGVAAFYAVAAVPVQIYLVLVATRELDIRRAAFTRNIIGVAQAALGMFVICWLARNLLVSLGVSPLGRLLAVIGVGILTYLLAINWRDPTVVSEIRGILPRWRWARMRRAAAPGGQA